MKILRVRRGFTTNSSSASEWASSPSGTSVTKPTPNVLTPTPSAGRTPLPVGATIEILPSAATPEPPAAAAASGGGAIGPVGILGLGAFVVALIAGDRIVRGVIARSKSKKP